MKKCQHFDEVDELFESVNIPKVNMSKSIMDKIEQLDIPQRQRRITPKKTMLLAAALVIVLTFATVLADGFGLEGFINGMKNMNEGYYGCCKIYSPISKQEEIVYFSQPVKFRSLKAFEKKINRAIPMPTRLPEGYSFKEAYIFYDSDMTYVPTPKNEEQLNANKFVPLCKGTRLTSCILNYSNGQHTISFSVSFGTSSSTEGLIKPKVIEPTFSVMEDTKVNGNAAIYSKLIPGYEGYVLENGKMIKKDMGDTQKVYWLIGKDLVSVEAEADINIDKAVLMSIAESVAENR